MEQKCAVAPVGTEPACGSTPDPVQVKTPHHLLPFMIIYLTALSLSLSSSPLDVSGSEGRD